MTTQRALTPPYSLTGVQIAFVAYLAFAISDASIKLLDGRVDPFQVAFTGAVLGFVALPFIRGKGERPGDLLRTTNRPLWLMRAAATAVSTVASVIAFTHLPMPEAFALIFLMPLFVTLLSIVLLHEQVGPWRWAAVIIGFAGVLVVLRPGFRVLGVGHLGAFLAGLASAVAIVLYRMAGPDEKRVSIYGAGLIGPLVVNGLLMIPGFAWPTGNTIGWLLSYGLLAAAGQALLMTATRVASASSIAPPQYSQMIWAVGFSYFLFHQDVDGPSFVGITIILAAGLITWARERVCLPARLRRMPVRPR